MNDEHVRLASQFPELTHAGATMYRLAEAFVAPEYARAGIGLIRRLVTASEPDVRFGDATVVTSPHDYSNVVVTVGEWWLLNFHIANAESLEEGDAVEEINPEDYDRVLEEGAAEAEAAESDQAALEVAAEEGFAGAGDIDDDDEEDLIEATFYQVGTFLLDGTIIPAETIFDREDLDCYAYDYPEERIAGDRFYWARLVWEPEDLENEELVAAVRSALNYVLENNAAEVPFADYHDDDFARLVADPELTERVIATADFGDVIVIDGSEDDE